jgi:TRAP-type C4-dicarboxylate transport system permease small subunit
MVETFNAHATHEPGVPPEGRMLPEEVIGTILFVGATALAGAQVFLRAAFNIGLPWGQELVVVMIIWSVFIGAAAVTARRRHVRMDLLAASLPPRPSAAIEMVAAMAVLIYIVFVLGAACTFQYFLYESNEFDPSTGIATWWLFLGLPIGAAAMSYRSACDVRARFRAFRTTL